VQPTLGEAVVVTGLGLIGLVTVQLLRAQGCRVLGLDFDPAKLEMARRFGAETVDLKAGADPVATAMAFSRGRGVDAVIITASAKSNEPVHQATAMDSATRDSFTVTLRFEDGSMGTIIYLANGSKAFPKERLEVFAAGRVLQLDNFRKLAGFGWPGFSKMNLWRQDKGQAACAKAFVDAVGKGGESPIPLGELLEVAPVTLELAEAL
jgi:threonine dehydrogenase-like Zn-dependent dehydrogenase